MSASLNHRQAGLLHTIKHFTLGWIPRRVPIAIKLALSIALLIVCGMSLLGFTILENQKTIMTEQVINMGTTVTSQIADSAKEMVMSDDTLGLQTLVNSLVNRHHILGAIVVSDKGQALASGGTIPGAYTIDFQRKKVQQVHQVSHFEWGWNLKAQNPDLLVTFVSPIHFKDLLAGHAMVTFSKNAMVQSLQQSKHVIIMTTIFMTIIAIIIAFMMSRHLSKPIYSLVDASKAIGEGNYRFRLSERRNDEIGELAHAFNHMADGLLKKSQVEEIFSRYVSSSVARKIMENLDEVELGGKHVNATVVFADIVGFTSLSENMPPKDVASLLNEYFSYISCISELYQGHIDKFMGDCAMAVFGVPEHDSDHSFHAISCAVMIQKLVARLNEIRLKKDLLPVHFRIGINSGNMVAGNLGSSDRMEYTVIGDPVNLASRLSSVAGSDQIVIMDELHNKDDIKDRIIARQHEIIRIRGKQQPVSTYLVEDIKASHKEHMEETIDAILKKYSTS